VGKKKSPVGNSSERKGGRFCQKKKKSQKKRFQTRSGRNYEIKKTAMTERARKGGEGAKKKAGGKKKKKGAGGKERRLIGCLGTSLQEQGGEKKLERKKTKKKTNIHQGLIAKGEQKSGIRKKKL